MTFAPPVPLLAATPALRPVFLIVMGAFLLLTIWRMTRGTSGWTPRFLLSGAAMLAFGYSVATPLYQAGIVVPLGKMGLTDTAPEIVLLWHVARMVCMNAGWLFLGLGLALHAGLFETAKSPAPVQAPRTSPVHEPVA